MTETGPWEQESFAVFSGQNEKGAASVSSQSSHVDFPHL